jgi:hypothetical protein
LLSVRRKRAAGNHGAIRRKSLHGRAIQLLLGSKQIQLLRYRSHLNDGIDWRLKPCSILPVVRYIENDRNPRLVLDELTEQLAIKRSSAVILRGRDANAKTRVTSEVRIATDQFSIRRELRPKFAAFGTSVEKVCAPDVCGCGLSGWHKCAKHGMQFLLASDAEPYATEVARHRVLRLCLTLSRRIRCEYFNHKRRRTIVTRSNFGMLAPKANFQAF